MKVHWGKEKKKNQNSDQMLPLVGLDLLKALIDWSLDAGADSIFMFKLFSQMFSPIS